MGLCQQLRVMLFQPHQFIQGIEAECPDAGDLLQALRGDQLSDVLHHCERARAFPADRRVEQRTVLIDQRAVNAKGGHRDAANPARGQFGREALTAVGEALQNSLQRPLVPRGVLRGALTGVGG